jgi:hypothetical protein
MSGCESSFLDRLATQLKVKKKFEDGKYKNHVEAEADFRQLVDRDEGCTR